MNGRLNWVAGKRRPIFDSEVYLEEPVLPFFLFLSAEGQVPW